MKMGSVNHTITSVVNKIINYVSFTSKRLTEAIVSFLKDRGVNVTPRWASLLVMLLSVLFFYIGLKVSKPISKWVMIILSILLLLGLFIPFW